MAQRYVMLGDFVRLSVPGWSGAEQAACPHRPGRPGRCQPGPQGRAAVSTVRSPTVISRARRARIEAVAYQGPRCYDARNLGMLLSASFVAVL